MITRRQLFGLVPVPFLSLVAPKKYGVRVERVPNTANQPWLPAPEDLSEFWTDFCGHKVYGTNWSWQWPFGDSPWLLHRTSSKQFAEGTVLLYHAFLLRGHPADRLGFIESVPLGFSVERTRPYDGRRFRFTVSDVNRNRGARLNTGATHWEQEEIL